MEMVTDMTAAGDQPATGSGAVIYRFHLDGRGGGSHRHGSEPGDDTTTGFDWLHLRSDHPGAVKEMQAIDLDPKVISALTAMETRPRMQQLSGGVLINLRGVNTNPGSDPEDMVSVRIWFRDDMIVSTRRHGRKLLSVVDVTERIEDGLGPRTPGEFVVMLIERLANRIGDFVDLLDEELARVETNLNVDNIRQVQQQLSDLRKQTAMIRRYLAPQREALAELYRSRKHLSDEDCHGLHFQTDRITRYVEDLDLAREQALVLHAELQNRIAEQQSSRTYLLSIVATIFLPLSFLTGIFGMNVAGLPGLENSAAFSILSVAMAVLAVILIGFMWLKKWL
jgi:zinc transporter